MGKFLKLTITVLTLLIITGMGTVVYLFTLPGELPEISGRKEVMDNKVKVGPLFDNVQMKIKGQQTVEISESQLNHYLASRVKAVQAGKLSEYLKIEMEVKGLWVKLKKDTVVFYIEREVRWGGGKDENGVDQAIQKQDHITSFSLGVKTTEDQNGALTLTFTPGEGRVGGVPTPGLFATIAKQPFDKLRKVMEKEMQLFSQMTSVHVHDGRIEMNAKRQIVVKAKPSDSGKVK